MRTRQASCLAKRAGLIAALLAMGAWPVAALSDPSVEDPPPEEDGRVIAVAGGDLGEPSESRPPNNFQGYKCELIGAGCPAGIILVTPEGNDRGCEAVDSICEGDCYSCGGAGEAGRFCVQATDTATCKIPGFYYLNFCGGTRTHGGGCKSLGPGIPPTPNGCECDTSVGFVWGVNCFVAECG